jgi:hypothetical protein
MARFARQKRPTCPPHIENITDFFGLYASLIIYEIQVWLANPAVGLQDFPWEGRSH